MLSDSPASHWKKTETPILSSIHTQQIFLKRSALQSTALLSIVPSVITLCNVTNCLFSLCSSDSDTLYGGRLIGTFRRRGGRW
ncbi:hypothetical protein M404DRAFT_477375 [Pisolithus tinctorius Marx 270]|uniref:Uncharacterized protein n=1 Tax=Pisolithus tinctorius Marx 270 TaxID=870435 RepID=A0A0C3JB07_PISTI|nr:hypothetical protein M404DRAFT_477375 [Pisolithus tinctorius Marx 270]